jgi:hypothetical protein
MRHLIWLPLILLLQFCSNDNSSNESSEEVFPVIKVKEAFDKKTRIIATDIFSSIEYVALETNEQCAIKANPEIYVADNSIVVVASRQIFVFDRNTGDFVREIGHRGKGPGEYSGTIREGEVFNHSKNIVRARRGKDQIIEYELTGTVSGNIFTPVSVSPFIETEPGKFIGYVPNDDGKEEIKLIAFDSLGQELYRIENTDFFERQVPGMYRYLDNEACLFKYDDHCYFKEAYNDTLYLISNKSIIPSAIFDTQGLSPYFGIKGEKEYSTILPNTFHIKNVFQVKNYLFFTISFNKKNYSCYYNFSNGKTVVSNYNEEGDSGIYDNINVFASFILQRTNPNNEIIGYLDAQTILTYYETHPEVKSKLLAQLQNVKPVDNPVIVIAKIN